jgi:hypothetical protein
MKGFPTSNSSSPKKAGARARKAQRFDEHLWHGRPGRPPGRRAHGPMPPAVRACAGDRVSARGITPHLEVEQLHGKWRHARATGPFASANSDRQSRLRGARWNEMAGTVDRTVVARYRHGNRVTVCGAIMDARVVSNTQHSARGFWSSWPWAVGRCGWGWRSRPGGRPSHQQGIRRKRHGPVGRTKRRHLVCPC